MAELIAEEYAAPNVDRIPPNNVEAEMAVLGAVLVDRDMFDTVSAIVQPEDFYAILHETIFASFVALVGANRPIDKVSLAEELRARGMLDKVGGLAYLTSLMDTVPSVTSAEYYARIVREKAQLRSLIRAGAEITRVGYEGESDVARSLTLAEAALGAATERSIRAVVIERAGDVAQRIIDRIESGAVEAVFRPPWGGLNDRCGGFMPGELVGWVAAPKVGKSGVVLGLADYNAMHYGATALFVPENGVERTVMRHLAMHTGIPARRQRSGNLDAAAGEMSTLISARRTLASRALYCFGREVRSLAAMWRVLRRIARVEPVTCVVLDHVGKLDEVRDERRGTTEHQRLSNAYETLLEMAAEFRCPVHVVQHLNREGYKPDRSGDMPEPSIATMAHIRGGGNLEGHADHVIFPYRRRPLGSASEREEGKFIVALTRDGDGGYVDMRYIGFRNLWLEHFPSDDGGQTATPWFEHNRAPRVRRPDVDFAQLNELFPTT